MKRFIVIILLSFCVKLPAQNNNNSRLQISVITCSPGNELYSIFGHTALRIIDSTRGTDIFYNYGTFDFEDPNFLIKFTCGKLDYFLSVEDAVNFFASYQAEGRSITEQILNISDAQKTNIQQALVKNLSGNNKFYKYDFIFDNCTTRIRDLLRWNTHFVDNTYIAKPGTTFRNLLNKYLDSSGMYWSKLGIDILLGSKIDKAMTAGQSSFLPDYFMFAIDSFNVQKPFLAERKFYKASVPASAINNAMPLIIFGSLAILMVALLFIKTTVTQKIFNGLAAVLVFITGLIGCLLLFMWLGTDHKSCAANYNLLWALPTNLVACFCMFKQKAWIHHYFKIAFGIAVCLLGLWFILPQQFNIALLPLTIAMSFVYWRMMRLTRMVI